MPFTEWLRMIAPSLWGLVFGIAFAFANRFQDSRQEPDTVLRRRILWRVAPNVATFGIALYFAASALHFLVYHHGLTTSVPECPHTMLHGSSILLMLGLTVVVFVSLAATRSKDRTWGLIVPNVAALFLAVIASVCHYIAWSGK